MKDQGGEQNLRTHVIGQAIQRAAVSTPYSQEVLSQVLLPFTGANAVANELAAEILELRRQLVQLSEGNDAPM